MTKRAQCALVFYVIPLYAVSRISLGFHLASATTHVYVRCVRHAQRTLILFTSETTKNTPPSPPHGAHSRTTSLRVPTSKSVRSAVVTAWQAMHLEAAIYPSQRRSERPRSPVHARKGEPPPQQHTRFKGLWSGMEKWLSCRHPGGSSRHCQSRSIKEICQ